MNHFSEITINYKPLQPLNSLPVISSSSEAYRILTTHWSDKINYKEEFVILLMNRANRVLGISKIGEGGTSCVAVDLKMIFQAVLKSNASAIILAHNHPSGSLRASSADIEMTKKIVQVGKLLEIDVHDHLIITSESFYSLSDNCDM